MKLTAELSLYSLQASYQRYGKQVLVCKFIVGELDIAA